MTNSYKASKHSVIIGGAGFIGSQLANRLLNSGLVVTVIDNLSRGKIEYLEQYFQDPNFKFMQCDVSHHLECQSAFNEAFSFKAINDVWHLAANSDIPAGVNNPTIDHRDTFLTTFELLRVMKEYNIPVLHFASSSAIYGDLGSTTLHENIGPLLPISNYGAMKLASEAQISAAAESFLTRANIFRFPNVVGVPATHGVILDFMNKLSRDPSTLNVLGDGSQQKAYLHVSDLINAMLLVSSREVSSNVEVVNIGPVDDGVTVKWIAEQVVSRVKPEANIVFGTGNKGWVGDVPRFNYSTNRLQSYGWSPELGSDAAVTRAIDEIAIQQGF